MNQNETLQWEFLISGMWKTHIWTNYISTVDVPTVALLYGQEVALKKFSVERHTVMMDNPLVP
jgi:hypothetical protein